MTYSSRSASDIVRHVLEKDPAIQYGLASGLVNIRALARHIQTRTREHTTFEALIAAIRRYPIKETVEKRKALGKLIDKLGMKNKIVQVKIRNDSEIPRMLAKFSEAVDYARGETFSTVSGMQNTTVIIDAKNLEKLKSLIPKKNVLDVRHNLAAVVVNYSDIADDTPGFFAALSSEVAMEEINIPAFVHSPPELAIVVDSKDALRTYQAMERLSTEQFL